MSAIGPYAFSPADAARWCGLLLPTPCRKDGRRTLILRAELEGYIAGLSTARPALSRGDHGRFAPK